ARNELGAAAVGNPDAPVVVTPGAALHAWCIRQAPRQLDAPARIDVAMPGALVHRLASDRAVSIAAAGIVAAGVIATRITAAGITATGIAAITVVPGISVADAAGQAGRCKRNDESEDDLHGKLLAAIRMESTSSM